MKQIAADAGVPADFLAKILQDLVRHGLLKSNKGPRGGFRLTVPGRRNCRCCGWWKRWMAPAATSAASPETSSAMTG